MNRAENSTNGWNQVSLTGKTKTINSPSLKILIGIRELSNCRPNEELQGGALAAWKASSWDAGASMRATAAEDQKHARRADQKAGCWLRHDFVATYDSAGDASVASLNIPNGAD